MTTILIIAGLVLSHAVVGAAGFVFGIGFGRKNKNTVETVVSAGKSVGELAK